MYTDEFGEKKNGVAKVSYTHDALIAAIIANPALTQRELGAIFGYTEGWISQIMSSDSFKVRLEAKRKEVVDPILVATTEERLAGLANQSITVLAEKLETTRSADLAVRSLEISTRALGYGARDRSSGVVLQQQFVVALPTKAENGEEWRKEYAPRAMARISGTPITIDTVIEEATGT